MIATTADDLMSRREETPDIPRFAVIGSVAQSLHGDALAIEHAQHVVVGKKEERGGIGEGNVVGEPACLGVSVRAEDGEILNVREDASGDLPGSGIWREETVWMEERHPGSLLSLRQICLTTRRQPGE